MLLPRLLNSFWSTQKELVRPQLVTVLSCLALRCWYDCSLKNNNKTHFKHLSGSVVWVLLREAEEEVVRVSSRLAGHPPHWAVPLVCTSNWTNQGSNGFPKQERPQGGGLPLPLSVHPDIPLWERQDWSQHINPSQNEQIGHWGESRKRLCILFKPLNLVNKPTRICHSACNKSDKEQQPFLLLLPSPSLSTGYFSSIYKVLWDSNPGIPGSASLPGSHFLTLLFFPYFLKQSFILPISVSFSLSAFN